MSPTTTHTSLPRHTCTDCGATYVYAKQHARVCPGPAAAPPVPREILDGLGEAGAAVVTSILADLRAANLEPDARETELLRNVGQVRDRMADLEDAIAVDGLRRLTKAGSIQLHPAVGELRNHALALGKLLAGVALVDTSAGKSARHQRAAASRWGKEASRG